MKDIDKQLDTKIRDTLDQMMIASQNAIVGYSNGDWLEEAVNEIKQLINQARIDELEKVLPALDKEFAYYAGGKPYSKATGTVNSQARTKKIIDDRLKELKGE